MSFTWLLEPEVFQGDLDPLIEKLEEDGADHVVCKFGVEYEHYFRTLSSKKEVVLLGSMHFARLAKQKTEWTGVYCDPKKFNCEYYYPCFGDQLLNSRYVMLPFGDLARRKEWAFQSLAVDGKIFLRPTDAFKTFSGMVLDEETYDREVKRLGLRLDPDTMVVMASPQKIKSEWRVVMSHNRVIAGSKYKEGGKVVRERGIPDKVERYISDLDQDCKYRPELLWVIDICELEGGKYDGHDLRVVEVGPFSCCGHYAANPVPIIREVNRIHERNLNV